MSAAPSVHVVGVSHVDVTVRGHEEWRTPGNGTIRTATALSSLGLRTSIQTCIGADNDGSVLLHHLLDANITIPPGCLTTDPTSTITRSIDTSGRKTRTRHLHLALPTTPIPPAGAVCFGSASTFAGPTAAIVLRLAADASAAGAATFLDTHTHPDLVNHDDARTALRNLLPVVDVLRMSRKDAAWLFPGEHPADIARRLAKSGPTLVMFTLGLHGTVLATANRHVRIGSTPTRPQHDDLTARLITAALGRGLDDLRMRDLRAIGAFCNDTKAARRDPNPVRPHAATPLPLSLVASVMARPIRPEPLRS
jgi:sugar/nucleoside kinase (ribokinase family)